MRFIAVCLACWLAVSAPALATDSDGEGGFCPLYLGGYQADLAGDKFEGQVGRPVKMQVNLDPAEPPAGYFASVRAEFESSSEKTPEIHADFPSISITCSEVGQYSVKVTVEMMATPKCGGGEVETLLDRTITLSIFP